jgi:uncharacterized protein (DUF952 family)
MPAGTIYKLLTRSEWEDAQAAGVYRGSSHDWRDGFIHFSTAAQLGETARKYFTGEPDLVLLAVEVGALKYYPSPQPSPARGEGAGRACCEGVPEVTGDSPLPSRERGRGEGEPLRWEPARCGDLFPHLYGDLPLDAVKSVTPILPGADGVPILPGGLEP